MNQDDTIRELAKQLDECRDIVRHLARELDRARFDIADLRKTVDYLDDYVACEKNGMTQDC